MQLFDSHVHFNAQQYSDEEREQALKEFSEIKDYCNISARTAIDVGFDLNSSLMAVKHAEKHTGINQIFAAVGIHPDYASEEAINQIDELKSLIAKDVVRLSDDGRMMNKIPRSCIGQKHQYIKAVGEIGLDYHNMKASKEFQREAFVKQIRLAKECCLPIIIHSRKASQETMDILKTEGAFSEGYGILLHSYTGSAEFAKEYLKLGAYFAFGGAITYENNKKTVEAVKVLPMERILVETDAPFQTPAPFRGVLNKTSNLDRIICKIAEIKDISFEEVAEITTCNGNRFFSI